MVTVRSCCLCINIRTGTFILGTVGIIMGAIFLAPMSVFLDHHSFYVTQFVTSEREAGKFMDDDQVPRMAFFSKMLFSILLSLDVIYIFSCILLLVGVAAVRHMLMMPWLIYVFCGILTQVTLVLAFMISLADYGSVGVFLASSPSLSLAIYFWLVVYSCYLMIKKEEISRRGPQTGVSPHSQSSSHVSLSSLKENITRAIRGTPPPPYEAVTSKSPPKPPKKSVEQSSCSSLVDLLHFKSSSEQSPRSTPSNSRRSSNGPTSSHSTKPVSPTSLRKRSCASDLIMVNPDQCTGVTGPQVYQNRPRQLTSSQSHTTICGADRQHIKKSHSSMVSFQHQPSSSMLIKFSQSNLEQEHPPLTEIEKSEISDELSSMSSTSLSIQDSKIV